MEKYQYKLANPAIMWSITIIGGVVLWVFMPQGNSFSSDLLGPIAFGLALANWLWVSVLAMRVHRKAAASVSNIDELITEGTYAVVRHPMYVADIILGWSVFIWQPSYKILAIVIWLMLVLVFWAYLEEWMLE